MSLFSSITDFVGLTDTGAGEKAARQAAQATGLAADEAKGLLTPGYADAKRNLNLGQAYSARNYIMGADRYLEDISGGMGLARDALTTGRDQSLADITGAGGLSREALSGSMGLSRDALAGGLESATGTLQPLADIGMGALDYLQAGATPGGYASNIEQLRTGGSLDPLIAENRRNVESELAAQGLTRSGSGITELSQIPIETIMGIESNLYGRQGGVANYGLPAVSNIAQLQSQYGTNLANLERGYGQDVAGLETGIGRSLADINTGFAAPMANLEYGYGQDVGGTRQSLQNLIGQGQQNLYGNRAQLSIGEAQDLANITSGQGAAQSSAILAGAQANAADRAALGNIIGTGVGAYFGA